MHQAPFCKQIIKAPMPKKFSPPQFQWYFWGTYSIDYVLHYRQMMASCPNINDAALCKVFLTSLQYSALVWFKRLQPDSICYFSELPLKFMQHYPLCIPALKGSNNLFQVFKYERENIKRLCGEVQSRRYAYCEQSGSPNSPSSLPHRSSLRS